MQAHLAIPEPDPGPLCHSAYLDTLTAGWYRCVYRVADRTADRRTLPTRQSLKLATGYLARASPVGLATS